MLVPFLIMLREGVEAALIVGIVASYLKQTGRGNWLFAVWAGVSLAILLCAAAGLLLAIVNADFPQKQQELFEAIIGVVAVGMLTSMVFWMKKAARSMKSGLHGSIDAALSSSQNHGLALVGLPQTMLFQLAFATDEKMFMGPEREDQHAEIGNEQDNGDA